MNIDSLWSEYPPSSPTRRVVPRVIQRFGRHPERIFLEEDPQWDRKGWENLLFQNPDGNRGSPTSTETGVHLDHRLTKPRGLAVSGSHIQRSPKTSTPTLAMVTKPGVKSGKRGVKAGKRKRDIRPFPIPTPDLRALRNPQQLILPPATIQNFSDSTEDGQEADPNKLCPYCDEPLPDEPTDILKKMMEAARQNSRLSARQGNSLGLTAGWKVSAPVCQRHKFERETIPKAVKQGWPLTLDFSTLPGRIEKLYDTLAFMFQSKDSWYWKEVNKRINEVGLRQAMGLKEDIIAFEKYQPGYYGGRGHEVIMRVLMDMFPTHRYKPGLIAPLNHMQFLERVLLPEVGAALISEDRNIELPIARRVMAQSAQYGATMFPAEDNDSDDGGLAEEMVELGKDKNGTREKRKAKMDAKSSGVKKSKM